jgi:hypothetical protein
MSAAWRATAMVPLVLCACTRSTAADAGSAATWPPFPETAEARAALTAQLTRRPVTAAPEPTPEVVFAAAERAGWSTLPSGHAAVREWLDRRRARWLLFGTFHDASGQLEAFRALIGPRGVPFTHVVLEQLRADGHWSGLDGGQAGDSATLRRLWATSERSDWAQLEASQAASDYTAWKYGYVAGVLDVVATARALGAQTFGCDLPDGLLRRLPNGTDDDVLRLRELHCLLALRGSLGPASRVAMVWGHAHVRPEGFRRFLPPDEAVVVLTAIGARHSDDAPDEQLRERLVLNDPVLVPLGGDDAALLLPDARLGGHVTRVRTGTGVKGLVASATTPGVLTIGGRRAELRGEPVNLTVAPGSYTYLYESAGLRVVGQLKLGDAGGQLSFDVPARATELVFDAE